MGSYAYQVWWMVSLILLLAFANWIGKKTGHGGLGILIDNRGR